MSELEYLARLVPQGRVSRRAFMGRAAALGVSAGVASSMLAKNASAQTPNKGGRMRYGSAHGSTTDSLDPGTYENNYMIALSFAQNNFLTEIAADGSLAAELAESWEASDDAKVWTFKLRQGVEFHNGKSLDAEDVVASINHHRGEDSTSAAKVIVDPIAEIKADGADTVVVTLDAGNADFPYIVSDYHVPILPSADGEVDWQSGTGTGPYALDNFDPGVRSYWKRNPNYWKEGRAHFDELEFLAIIDVAARTNALTSGEVDVIDRVDLKTVHLLQRSDAVRIEQTSGTQHYTFAMRTDMAPYDNNDVRLALKYGIDREAILQAVLRGYGVVGNDHPIGQANRYHAADLPQRTFDPDKAKFHLQQAGLSELTVDLSAADAAFAGAVDAAVLYREHAAAAGINLNVVREPNDGYWSNVWMQKPWCAVYWGGRPTEDWMFSTAYAEGAAWNDSFWSHERFNVLLNEARSELNETKRRDMYVEMQQIVSDDGGVVVPMFANYVFAVTDKVQHEEQMAANWDLDGNKFSERWWFS